MVCIKCYAKKRNIMFNTNIEYLNKIQLLKLQLSRIMKAISARRTSEESEWAFRPKPVFITQTSKVRLASNKYHDVGIIIIHLSDFCLLNRGVVFCSIGKIS